MTRDPSEISYGRLTNSLLSTAQITFQHFDLESVNSGRTRTRSMVFEPLPSYPMLPSGFLSATSTLTRLQLFAANPEKTKTATFAIKQHTLQIHEGLVGQWGLALKHMHEGQQILRVVCSGRDATLEVALGNFDEDVLMDMKRAIRALNLSPFVSKDVDFKAAALWLM